MVVDFSSFKIVTYLGVMRVVFRAHCGLWPGFDFSLVLVLYRCVCYSIDLWPGYFFFFVDGGGRHLSLHLFRGVVGYFYSNFFVGASREFVRSRAI